MESWTADFFEENSTNCIEELKDDSKWSKIPMLKKSQSHLLKEGQFVRFKGMIQDMLNPVYFLAKYEVHNTVTNEKSFKCGKYKDTLQCADHEKVLFDSEACEHQERRPMYCISVPAVNDWAKDKHLEPVSIQQSNKEQLTVSAGVKRSADSEESMEVDNTRPVNNDDSIKRLRSAESTMESESSETPSGPIDLNLPIPDEQAEACLINLYDLDKASSLKMNDVIEAAGFLSFDDAAVTSEDGEQYLPPSLVPRLHAVTWKTVSSTPPTQSSDAVKLRDELRLVLTQLLLGDALAAEYLICHLISRVYLRQDVLVLGKFSLNLSNIPISPEDYTTQLYQFLQNLLNKSHYLAMTVENMNSTVMIPKKNYETNRLDSGMLQLSSKTHLVLDETKMQPGKLDERGVHNCRALNSVIVNQRMEYNFQFYGVEFHTDIPILILSEGKSLLPSDYLVPLQPDPLCLSTISEVFTAATHYLQEPLLTQLRNYVATVTNVTYDLSDEVQKIVQEDFVKMRQDNQKFNAQDLHSLLVLARYLSLSEGSLSLTKDCWARALQMERERKQRLNK
ncbi:mini-chromosome maintenance complex-binding protein [Macrosteles quadrilineatus]|uniref:mini-chromosome maintenance complex-binding protein n=1 Tax=Macrosteles quadrilineatus TaxID=74068 RepID=UPI0023E094EA|nr:mini-chromosome maintenance complex-binding protein [Macrosteles quadrilineatus]XP_054258531.1 mini-chromosome maintenance complex-binding protein [Macrosteles quadrilineatus]